MKAPIRCLWMALGLAVFLVLPAQASEPPAGLSSPEATVLPADFVKIPAPQWMTGTVDCSSCASATPNPAAQCTRYCRSLGQFADSCEADATTCELLLCFCM